MYMPVYCFWGMADVSNALEIDKNFYKMAKEQMLNVQQQKLF